MICRCITWIKKHPVLSLFFLILMYLVIGATAPFYHYKPISQETQDTVSAENFYQEGDSRDRAMILETNQSAWDERMRLMNWPGNGLYCPPLISGMARAPGI